MANVLYFGLWLAAALAVVGALSAFLARQRRWREGRVLQAVALCDALARYGDWVGLQGRTTAFQGADAEAEQALAQASQLRAAWFPELAAGMARVLDVHHRLTAFLAAQRALQLAEPETWLESDHDSRYHALAQEQATAIAAMRAQLRLADAPDAPLAPLPAGGPIDSRGA